MSLIKQLWIIIVTLTLLAFLGSFAVSTVSARQYLAEQLRLKDIDTASSMALTLSQVEKEPVTLELLISALFDNGHYQRIALFDASGDLVINKQYQGGYIQQAPNWFHRIMAVNSQPAQGLIQDGWQQFGELWVHSHSGYAIDRLWQGTVRLLQWFVALGLLSGLLGTWVLRWVSRPLSTVVGQAEAIGERRFVRAEVPRTQEFRRLVIAMNRLSDRVRRMLEKEAQKLDQLHQQLHTDALTGLHNRSHFLDLLQTRLSDTETGGHGGLLMLRLMDIQQLNVQLGRKSTDALLVDLAANMKKHAQAMPDVIAGRLNATDMLMFIPARFDAESLAQSLREAVNTQLSLNTLADVRVPMAMLHFDEVTALTTLLSGLDGALAQAEQQGRQGWVSVNLQHAPRFETQEQWRAAIINALQNEQVQLAHYPVCDLSSNLLHWESPVRLRLNEEWLPAREFIAWVARVELLAELDIAVLKAALAEIAEHGLHSDEIAFNISEEAITHVDIRQQLIALLAAAGPLAQRLIVECSEATAVRHSVEFRSFSAELHRLGCSVGLKQAGAEFAQIEDLQGLGLRYIKIDGTLIHNVHKNQGNQSLVQGLCALGHSLGIEMIAQNVTQPEEAAVLSALGVDGQTGAWVRVE